jgi:hypothetical protein
MEITIKKIIKSVIPYGFIILYRKYKDKKRKNNTKNDFEWAMSVNERELFKKYIMDAKVYLEFGSGGSTITALNETMCNVYSVESSKEWKSHMKKTYGIITESIDSGRLNYIYTDIGTGTDITIKELAHSIMRTVYANKPDGNCTIEWDSSKPNGTPRKLLDVGKLKSMGWQAKTNLNDGIAKAYTDFLNNHANKLRLVIE